MDLFWSVPQPTWSSGLTFLLVGCLSCWPSAAFWVRLLGSPAPSCLPVGILGAEGVGGSVNGRHMLQLFSPLPTLSWPSVLQLESGELIASSVSPLHPTSRGTLCCKLSHFLITCDWGLGFLGSALSINPLLSGFHTIVAVLSWSVKFLWLFYQSKCTGRALPQCAEDSVSGCEGADGRDVPAPCHAVVSCRHAGVKSPYSARTLTVILKFFLTYSLFQQGKYFKSLLLLQQIWFLTPVCS